MKRFLFKDRDGRTPLSLDFKKDLRPEYKDLQLGGELDEAEENNIVEGLVWLEDQTADPKDWMFWERLHGKLFGKVWTWGGKFRTHELQNEEFNHPGYIRQNIKRLEGDLAFWFSLTRPPNPKMLATEVMARFHEGLLTIHPFSNGNGRTSRILVEAICKYEGLELPTWGASFKDDVKRHRQTYIAAILKARRTGVFEDLIQFMFEGRQF